MFILQTNKYPSKTIFQLYPHGNNQTIKKTEKATQTHDYDLLDFSFFE